MPPTTRFTVLDEVPVSADAQVYPEGWQSWSPTTWYSVRDAAHRPTTDVHHTMRFRPGADLPDGGFQGEGLLLVDPGGGATVRTYSAADAATEVPSLRAELRGDRLLISTDARANAVVATQADDRQAALRDCAAALAAPVVSVRPAPTAWCSWYRYFEEVRQEDILENLDAIGHHDLPVDVVQVDDGWSAGVGDWTELSARFTSLSTLASHVRAAGRRPGIWLAPFIAGRDSELARRSPHVLMGDAGYNWDQPLHGLDLTHPTAREYLWNAFRGLRDAGFDYFKLDFLYGGALPGVRYDDSGPVRAYRSGLELIRDAVGPESYLLGCGAPILPSVGLVDAMRVSPDTFHPEGQDGSSGLRGAMAATARSWQHGRFWVNDADCLVARPSYALRADWAAVVDRVGGLRSFSDRIAELDDWGIDTVRRLLAAAPTPTPFPQLDVGTSR